MKINQFLAVATFLGLLISWIDDYKLETLIFWGFASLILSVDFMRQSLGGVIYKIKNKIEEKE